MKMGYILISLGIVLVIAGAISLYQTKGKSDTVKQPAVVTHAISPTVQQSIVPESQETDSSATQTVSTVQVNPNANKTDKQDENERKG